MKEILLICLFLLLCTTCKEKEQPTQCNDANTVKFPVDAVRKTFFEDSTYWIYQDSATGQLDSVWVTNSQTGSLNKFQNITLHKKCYQWFSYELRSRFGGITSVYLGAMSVGDNIEYVNERFYASYIFITSGHVFGDRLILNGDNYEVHTNEGDSLIFLNDITIQNIKYNKVIQRINEPMTYDICKEIWYADAFGIIKYKMQNNSVWELLRCKIKQ